MEVVLEVLFSRLGPSAVYALDVLKAAPPNAIHLSIAALARAGLVASIITVNFDECIESALHQVGLRKGKDFDVLVGRQRPGTRSGLTVHKLHGTVSRPSTLIASLSTVGLARHSERETAEVLRRYDGALWLFTGYRGADLDLRMGLDGVLSRNAGIWNSLSVSDVDAHFVALLKQVGWQTAWTDASSVMRYILRRAGLSSPQGSERGIPGAPLVSARFHGFITGATRRDILKAFVDMAGHIGQNEIKYGLLRHFTLLGPGSRPRFDACLATGRTAEAAKILERMEARAQRSSPPVGLDPIARLLTARLERSRGRHKAAVEILEDLVRDYQARSIKLRNYDAVRMYTHLAETYAALERRTG